MKQLIKLPAVAALVALLAACDGDDGDNGINGTSGSAGVDGLNSLVATRQLQLGDAVCPGGGIALDSGLDTNRDGTLDAGEVTSTEYIDCERAPQLRAVHASPDAPAVNVWVNGAAALTDVPYGAGSGFLDVTTATQVQIEANIPGGNAIVIDESLTLDFNSEHTVLAVGTVATLQALVVSNEAGELFLPGNVRAQVVHAAPAAPAVDVYVTAPGADLATSNPINAAPLGFQDSTGRVDVPGGDYQIRVTAAGDPTTVVYDSGTVALAAGADLLIAAVANTGPGAAAVELVVLDGESASTIRDTGTPAAVVAVHASPDAPSVDILADSAATTEDDAIALARDVAFPNVCAIDAVPVGSYTLNITAAGDPMTVALSFPFEAAAATTSTAIVAGMLTSTPAIAPIALGGDLRSVATESKIRVTHASGATGAVDLYLVADGTDITSAEVMPSFGAVPFMADTGILSVSPGTYDVYVTPQGTTDTIAIEVQDLVLSAGGVLDVIARDPAADGSEGTLPQLIVIDQTNVADCTL